ncbi:MAG: hypothetical protein H7318_12300 [Oligoflexus sp.]|nr:hypothetical protein [Oligoflexus sp.]
MAKRLLQRQKYVFVAGKVIASLAFGTYVWQNWTPIRQQSSELCESLHLCSQSEIVNDLQPPISSTITTPEGSSTPTVAPKISGLDDAQIGKYFETCPLQGHEVIFKSEKIEEGWPVKRLWLVTKAANESVPKCVGVLELSLDDGTKKALVDPVLEYDHTKFEEYKFFGLRDYLNRFGMFVVEIAYYEGHAIQFISKKTGKETEVFTGKFEFSPDGRWLVSNESDLSGYNQSGLGIWPVNDDGLGDKAYALTGTKADWSTTTHWVDSETLTFQFLDMAFGDEKTNTERSGTVTLRLKDGKWQEQ